MGSWNVFCSASLLDIGEGDKIVLLPLIKRRTATDFRTHVPAILPIFGVYGDYGRIEEIEECENTKILEDIYDMSIEQITEQMTAYGETIEYVDGFMWFHRDIYDFLVSVGKEQQNINMGNYAVLESLGFTRDGNSKDDRYTEKWVKGEHVIHSDGNWCHLNSNTGEHSQSIYSFKDVEEVLGITAEHTDYLYFWLEYYRNKPEQKHMFRADREKERILGWACMQYGVDSDLESEILFEEMEIYELNEKLKLHTEYAAKHDCLDSTGHLAFVEKHELQIKNIQGKINNLKDLIAKSNHPIKSYNKVIKTSKEIASLSHDLNCFVDGAFVNCVLLRPTINHSPQWGDLRDAKKFNLAVKNIIDTKWEEQKYDEHED